MYVKKYSNNTNLKYFVINQISKSFSIQINTDVKDYFRDYIELRSDVKTLPTEKMKQAVFDYNYGDDIFQEDPTIRNLEDKLASLLKMDSGLFCPSGTMANMLALNLQSNRGDNIILGHKSHMSVTEKPQIEFYGFNAIRLNNLDNGCIEISNNYLKKSLDSLLVDPSQKISVIALEDSHNFCGGQILKRGFKNEFEAKLKVLFNKNSKQLPPFHLDGSRIFNSAVAQNTDEWKLAEGYDTVNVCLSKGIGAPVGSVLLLRNKKDYEKARSIRRLLGGALRQSGFLAAPAFVALENYRERMANDHKNAKRFEEIVVNGTKKLHLRLPSVTNICNLYCDEDKRHLLPQLTKLLFEKHKVLINPYPEYIRAVFHHQVDSSQAEVAAKKVIEEAEKLL